VRDWVYIIPFRLRNELSVMLRKEIPERTRK